MEPPKCSAGGCGQFGQSAETGKTGDVRAEWHRCAGMDPKAAWGVLGMHVVPGNGAGGHAKIGLLVRLTLACVRLAREACHRDALLSTAGLLITPPPPPHAAADAPQAVAGASILHRRSPLVKGHAGGGGGSAVANDDVLSHAHRQQLVQRLYAKRANRDAG